MADSCSDEEFISLFVKLGATKTAQILGTSTRNAFARRKSLEEQRSIEIKAPPNDRYGHESTRNTDYPFRVPLEIRNGVVLVGSDAHYWPGEASTAHKGLVHLAKEIQPAAIILNGDVFDGARVSRHPPIGFGRGPSVREELDVCLERLDELRAASPKSKFLWTLGNHDARLENRIAAELAELKDVHGTRLKDHFPHWELCWSIWINDEVVVKHRFKGGVHATHNNTVNAGKSMFTGHLHSLKVTPFDDYNGTRYGVDTGTLADPYGDQFTYSEDNPLNHRSGFSVATFHNGELLWPEIAHAKAPGKIQFRGKVIDV